MASPTSSLVPNPTSIPWNIYLDNQSFNLTGLDGTPITVSLTDINTVIIDEFKQDGVVGFIVGFTAMLMIILLLLTNREKARRPIFILNFLALFFLCFRSICFLVMFGSVIQGIGEGWIGAVAQYPMSLYAPQIMQGVLTPIIYALMLFSLVLQVRVVFAAEPATQKLITVIGSLAALFLVGLGWYLCAQLIEAIIFNINVESNWTYNCLRIGIMIFVGVSCLLFLYKLAVAIRRRKRMGFKKFGPLQVLFIIFAQCLVLPRTSPSFCKANKKWLSIFSISPSRVSRILTDWRNVFSSVPSLYPRSGHLMNRRPNRSTEIS